VVSSTVETLTESIHLRILRSTLYPKILQLLDMWARKIGSALGHQSDRKIPRAYFPNGVTGGTKLAGHEMNGVILVLLILYKMKESRKLLLSSKYFLEDHLRGWINLFESMLEWRWWLKLPSVPLSKIQASEYSTHKLLKLYRSVVKQKHGSGLLVIKFHLCLHFLEHQLDFWGYLKCRYWTGGIQPQMQCQETRWSDSVQYATF
jgi:hypothetical protein